MQTVFVFFDKTAWQYTLFSSI